MSRTWSTVVEWAEQNWILLETKKPIRLRRDIYPPMTPLAG
jgi:hypothetical protein